MGKYQEKYTYLKQNKIRFEQMLKIVKSKFLPFFIRYFYANCALKFAVYNHSGYFYSNTLEKFFVDIAQKYDLKNYNISYKPNTVLHVMTTAYTSGGHTRVVERWIENTKNIYENKVVLLNQRKQKVPDALSNYAITIKEKSKIKKALKLRELAFSYEYVVLHTHMGDSIATMAFGTEKFTRPVLFFNHSDHTFWIGRTIADKLLDFRTIFSTSKKYRDIEDAVLCPIPSDQSNVNILSKAEARKSLNIKNNEKIIVTAGSDFKYRKICKDNMLDLIDKILSKNIDTKLIAIGPNSDDWKFLAEKYTNRLILLEIIPYDEYLKYLACADIILDSYPFGGGTSLIDSMKAKTPVISLRPGDGSLDFMEKSCGICASKEEFIEKVNKALCDENYRNSILNDELTNFEKEYSVENWVNNVVQIFKTAPKKHKLRDISKESAPCFINDYGVLLNTLYNRNKKNSKGKEND